MSMTVEEYAAMLNGREYGYPQFTKEEIEIAKQNGFVIVYGASDDLMEFDGAISDEGDCFDGGTIYLCETGVVEYGSAETKSIEAVWCDKERTDDAGNVITWTYKTDIPHETFMIYDDGEPYCEAIVFCVDDIKYGRRKSMSNIEIVDSLRSLYPLKDFEEEAVMEVLKEFGALKEKAIKKVESYKNKHYCECGCPVEIMLDGITLKPIGGQVYCDQCGAKLDWSEFIEK